MNALYRLISTIAALLVALCAAHAAPQGRPFQFVMQNGMQVVVLPDHRAPVVTQFVVFKVGSVDDPPGESGMAHFFEHMMFRGTRSLSGDGYSQTVASNGGDDNAFTTRDYTVFHEQIAKDKLRLVMHIEADRMANLDLSDSAVSKERDVVLGERRIRIDNDPAALAQEQAEAALFLSHPYGRPVIGWPDEIRHIARVDADNFYRRHYAPNNAILIVAGDVTAEEVRAAAEAEYGRLPARELVARAEFAQPPRLGETRLVIARNDARVPLFLRQYRVPCYAEAAPGQAEALEVLAQVLGGGATSALYRKLVIERRLATDVAVDYEGYQRDAGEFTIQATPRAGVSLEAVEHAVDDVLWNSSHRLPARADLARAKTQLAAGATYRLDSQFDLGTAYASALAVGLTLYDVQNWPGRILAVAGADVRKAASASLVRKEAVTVYLTPAAQ